jgi:hypothetical protein
MENKLSGNFVSCVEQRQRGWLAVLCAENNSILGPIHVK